MKTEIKNELVSQGVKFNENGRMININLLASGAESVIHEIEETNLVLKTSSNEREYKAYESLLKINNNDLKEIFEFPLYIGADHETFYFIFKKLKPLDKKYKSIMRSIEYYLQQINVENMTLLPLLILEVRIYLNSKKHSDFELFLRFLMKAHRYLKEYNFSDIHNDNIMIDDKGNFKIIDIQL